MAFIDLEQVSFQYPQAAGWALKDVSLSIERGERVALVGANGSGKTTLGRLLNALYIPQHGRVIIAGMDTRQMNLHRSIRKQVGMIFQNPEDQLVGAVVEEDAAFGLENLAVPPDEMRRRVDGVLHDFELWEHRQRPPHLLSSGQMQRLALAGVLVVEPDVLVFDETTAMLDPAGRRTVMARMDELHQQGATLIAITHFMGEAARCERVVVLDHGKIALDGAPSEVFADAARLAQLGLHLPPAAALANRLRPYVNSIPTGILNTSDLLADLPVFSGRPDLVLKLDHRPGADVTTQPEVIEVRALGHDYLKDTPLAHRALHEVNLRIRTGCVYGLAGATGSGKSTLLQHLNGLLLPQTGRVRVKQFHLENPKVDRYAVRRMAGLAFQNPEMQLFETFVGDEIAFGPRQDHMSREEIRAKVCWAMGQVGLDFEGYKDRRVMALSGGERKKVALASILARQPEILLLDEPMAGLDPRSRSELLVALRRLATEGLMIIMSSHQMDDLAGFVDRVSVLAHGTNAFEGAVGDVFERETDLLTAGLEAPVAARVALELRKKGWPLPPGLVTPDALVHSLAGLNQGMS